MESKKRKSSRTRNYTKEQLLARPLTKAIISILGISKKEKSTTQIYNELKNNPQIKAYYSDRKQSDGATKKGLNRNTVLDHLNEMHKPLHDLITKKIIKNNIALWGLKKEIPFENYILEKDKFLLDICSGNTTVRFFDDYNINLYGYPNVNSHLLLTLKELKVDLKVNKKRLVNGIKTIKKGINEIQYARGNIINYHKISIYDFILQEFEKGDNGSLLDRRIFAILIFCDYSGFPFLYEDLEVIIDKIINKKPLIINLPFGLGQVELRVGMGNIFSQFSDFSVELENFTSLIISNPHADLINILKNNFEEYKSKTDKELKNMLNGYEFPRSLLDIFLYNAVQLDLLNRFFPIIAVAHSDNLYDIISYACELNEMYKTADSLKINKKIIENKFLSRQEDKNNIFVYSSEKEEKKSSYSEYYKQIKKIKNKCPYCAGEEVTRKLNIDEFLQQNMKWLT